MSNSTDIRTGRHCVFNLHVHLVFVTKYRRKVFQADTLESLRLIFKDVCGNFEATLVEFDGERDHVHLLVHYPPKLALSKLVNSLKGVSSRLLRKNSHYLKRYYWKAEVSPRNYMISCEYLRIY